MEEEGRRLGWSEGGRLANGPLRIADDNAAASREDNEALGAHINSSRYVLN